MKIQEVKKILIVLFMVGFLSGIVYANLFAKPYIVSMGIFSDYFLEQFSSVNINIDEYFCYIFRMRIAPLIFLGIAGCTKYKKIIGSVWILWTGFSCGIILTTAVLKLNIKGIVLCLTGILPHFVCYIAAYIIVLLYLFTYPEIRWNNSKTISIILFMLLGLVSECYINPVLMEIIIKML